MGDRFAGMPQRAAVWDLGSSSFHLLVCEVGPGGALTPVLHRRALLNLGLSVGASGSIPRDRVAAAVASVKRLRGALSDVRVEVVVALATAAIRDAANNADVVERLERAVGTPITVLGGEEEARLSFVGQRAGVWTGPGMCLGLDLGGGSLEVAVGDANRLAFATSVGVGAARLSGELGAGDPLTAEQRALAHRRTAEALVPVRAQLAGYGGVATRSIVSGGTARALARVATGKARRRASGGPGEVNQVELPADQVRELADLLGNLNLKQRLALPGMQARRADILPVGAAILAATATELNVDRYVVSEWGLREGALLDALDTAGSQ